ncbi:MAG: IclR family transcriptional regulator [Bacillota bacterium]|nr:IclR family transcriptional regulator [Bacillota bacterium]
MADSVQSLDRALSILELLSDFEEGLGLLEISSKLSLHKSTAHRLLASLIQNGYVEQNQSTNKYKLTFKLFELGNKKVEKMDILTLAKPYLTDLMEQTNETVHLVIRENKDIVYISKVESSNTIRMISSIGKKSPMYCTAVGKAILANLPEVEVNHIWSNTEINKLTEYTITDLNKLKEELKKIKERGFAIDEEENELGVRCIGAVIYDHQGNPNAAISISGPATRMTDEKIVDSARLLLQQSMKISKELGYRN